MIAEPVRPKRKRPPWEAFAVSALVHTVLLLGAAYLTVLVIQGRPKMTFEGKKNPTIPARKLEHSIRVKQMQKQTRKPQILQRLVSEAPSSVALPELPKIAPPDMKSLKDTLAVHAKAGGALGGLGSLGGGAGRGLTGGSGYSDTVFFGQRFSTRAVVICMDISPSMVNKGVVEAVRDESVKMLADLGPGTKFNLVVFVDGALAFAPEMLFATQENKQKADAWLKQSFNGRSQGNRRGYSGSTPSEALRVAVEMGADTIFVLSDDPPYLKEGNVQTGVEIVDHRDQIMDYVKDIEATQGRAVRIHPLLYKPFENERGRESINFYKKLAQRTGGRLQVIKDD